MTAPAENRTQGAPFRLPASQQVPDADCRRSAGAHCRQIAQPTIAAKLVRVDAAAKARRIRSFQDAFRPSQAVVIA